MKKNYNLGSAQCVNCYQCGGSNCVSGSAVAVTAGYPPDAGIADRGHKECGNK